MGASSRVRGQEEKKLQMIYEEQLQVEYINRSSEFKKSIGEGLK
jgi:hypothetical protein